MKRLSLFRQLALGLSLLLAITLIAILLISLAKQPPPDPITAIEADLVGYNYRFRFRYPGDDLVLYTSDDRIGMRNLYVPQNADVKLHLNSNDFVYTFEIPQFEVYEIAAPDLTFDVSFKAQSVGVHELLGSQMCGYDHSELLGKLIVQTEADYRRTVKNLPKAK